VRSIAKPARTSRPHIAVFLAPAVLVYTAVMIVPLVETLRLSLFTSVKNVDVFIGAANFRTLFFDGQWSHAFLNALRNNVIFFAIQMLQTPIGIGLAALLALPRLRGAAIYRTTIFLPTLLSFVIVGFGWKLILSPLWGVTPSLLGAIGLKAWFAPYLGREGSALFTLGLISVWQYVGVPMMLCYAALIAIPAEVLDAAEVDGITGIEQFLRIKLPLIWPTVGMISILTFVGNFNAFDLIYVTQGALAGPNYSTDILGTFLYRTFFGFQLQLGDPNMGATVATMMFLIILVVVFIYLFAVQRKISRYQF
jgi:raffinose/stachyose/melibiose transport system permease protein